MNQFFTIPRQLFCLFVLLLLVLSACQHAADKSTFTGNQKADSVAIWVNWVNAHKHLPLPSRKDTLKKAFVYTTTKLPDSLQTKKLSQIAWAYKALGDTTSFKKLTTQLITLASDIEDYQSLGEAHWDLGDFQKLTKPDSTYYHYSKALKQFQQATLDDNVKDYPGRILYAMAQVKKNNRDYTGAEKDIVQAVTFFKEKKVNKRLFQAYNLLANTQNGLYNLNKALEYHEKARQYIQFRRPQNQYRDSVYNIKNIATAYIRNENYDKGIELLNSVLQTDSLKHRLPETYARSLASLAEAKFKRRDTDTYSMKALLKESDAILNSLDNVFDKARNREFLAEILAAEKDTSQAITQATLGMAIAKQTNNNDRLLTILKLLTKINTKNSAVHAKAYFDLNDSLQAQERNIRDKFARIQLETDEVLEENVQLAKGIRTWTGIAGGLLLFGIAVFTIITLRNINQKLKFKQKQQQANQEIYNLMLSQQAKLQEGKQLEQKRVSEELHDGILGQMLGVRLILSGLNENIDDASIAQRAELIEKLRNTEEEIRTISHELNAASYQKIHNFILAIDELVKTTEASGQLQSSFAYDNTIDWDALDGETKINIYRIVQECLQNSLKHAKCDKIMVSFRAEVKKCIKLCIEDNGRGFSTMKGKKGIGMKNIASRTKKLSGTISIDSKIGEGTKILVTIPFNQEAAENSRTKKILEV